MIDIIILFIFYIGEISQESFGEKRKRRKNVNRSGANASSFKDTNGC